MKTTCALLGALAACAANATVTVSNVSFTQDADSHDVTVSYDLTTSDGEPAFVSLDVLTNGVSVGATRVKNVSGDVSSSPADTASLVSPGTGKRITWKARADLPGVGLANAAVRVTAIATNHFEGLYMVVDLSRGKNSSYWPVQYTACKPDTNSPAFYTTELWLRRVPAGTFTMGNAEDTNTSKPKPEHSVTLSHDYYCGVLPVTIAQERILHGLNSSTIATNEFIPANTVSYIDIRGSGWPQNNTVATSNTVGSLRIKTQLQFDLPTEAQWEYMARAGHAGNALGDGSSHTSANVAKLSWYTGNAGGGLHPVARKKPNSWDFYDTCGNTWEWCRDYANVISGTEYDSDIGRQTDPPGPDSNANSIRVRRSGACGSGWNQCSPWYRMISNTGKQGNRHKATGYRLVVETNEGDATVAATGADRGSADSAADYLETRPGIFLAGIRYNSEESYIDTATPLSFVMTIR